MAVTPSARLGLPISTAGTDARQNTRAKFNEILTKLDDQVAIDTQGLAADRPVEGKRGQFYYATDTAVLSRYNGSAWVQVLTPAADWKDLAGVSPATGWTVQASRSRLVVPGLRALSLNLNGGKITAGSGSQVVATLPSSVRPPAEAAVTLIVDVLSGVTPYSVGASIAADGKLSVLQVPNALPSSPVTVLSAQLTTVVPTA